MRSLNNYITEKFQVSKDNISQYAYQPKDKDELIDIIKSKIDKEGLGTKSKPLDLNDIDTSKINEMYGLFDASYGNLKIRELADSGCFDVSDWDVSNVKDMENMFRDSHFDGDLSDWDVSAVETMYSMFDSSSFTGKNGDISIWDVSNVKDMSWMFYNCPLEKNPPKWYKG